MDAVQLYMPGEAYEELLRIAQRFEEKMFQAATDQAIYFLCFSLVESSLFVDYQENSVGRDND
jgi:hypothetical protein